MAAGEMGRAAVLAALPEVFQRQLLAPYMLGSTFVARGNLLATLADGFPVEAANSLYTDPPLSSEQILHPAKYWDETQRDEPRKVELGKAGKALGGKWRMQMAGTMGELTLGSLVGAPTPGTREFAQTGEAWTNEAASGWGGDAWQLWASADSSVVLLGTRWDSDEDAVQFADALPGDAGLVWRRSADALAIVAGDAGERTELLLERMLAAMGDP
jgi:hypothetical protein